MARDIADTSGPPKQQDAVYQFLGPGACEELVTRQPAKVLARPRADPVGFEDFYRQHWAAVVRLAWTLTGRRALAEEIAQDAMLSAHRQWSRLSVYDRPDLWVRRVTINRCTSAFRRTSREARLVLRAGSRLRDGDPPPEPLPDIWRHVARLPRRQAQVIALRYLEDRSISDIAVALQLGEETVRTHLRRAHATLAQRLDHFDEDSP